VPTDQPRDPFRELLQVGSTRTSVEGPGPDCVDAETLAAWTEGALDDAERDRVEAHTSSCGWCGAAMAAMARSATDTSATRQPARWTHAQWLLPLAAAAALIVWGSAPGWRGGTENRDASAAATSELQQARAADQMARLEPSQDAPSAAAEAVPSSRAAVPAPRRDGVPSDAAPQRPDARDSGQAPARAREADTAAPPTAALPSRLPTEAEAGRSMMDRVEPFARAQPSGAAPASPPPAASPAAPQRLERETTIADSAAGRTAAGEPPLVQTQSGERTFDFAARGAEGRGGLAASTVRRGPSAQLTITSADGRRRWRVIPGAGVQVAAAAGNAAAGAASAPATTAETRTQSSTAFADRDDAWTPAALPDGAGALRIVAGSAPSEVVCWLVGDAGLVLRTTDGARFTRVAAPMSSADVRSVEAPRAPVAPDLGSVEALDALRATVTTTDGHRFVTTDGGASWRAQ
jgi:hypothetical protein